jgi:hypothetical protein
MMNAIKTTCAADILALELGLSRATWIDRLRHRNADGSWAELSGVIRFQLMPGDSVRRGSAITIDRASLMSWIAQQRQAALPRTPVVAVPSLAFASAKALAAKHQKPAYGRSIERLERRLQAMAAGEV